MTRSHADATEAAQRCAQGAVCGSEVLFAQRTEKGKEDFCGSDSSMTPCKNCSERGKQSMSEAGASWKDTSGCDQTRSLRHRCEKFRRSFVAH